MSDKLHPMSALVNAYGMKSRGIVIFGNSRALVWESTDGHAVQAWAQSFDTPENKTTMENGGVFHAVVYTVNTGFVSYETEH